ncbi:hypothetical protein BC831DRAFT_418676, partial [Entophlyctis helioformis]
MTDTATSSLIATVHSDLEPPPSGSETHNDDNDSRGSDGSSSASVGRSAAGPQRSIGKGSKAYMQHKRSQQLLRQQQKQQQANAAKTPAADLASPQFTQKQLAIMTYLSNKVMASPPGSAESERLLDGLNELIMFVDYFYAAFGRPTRLLTPEDFTKIGISQDATQLADPSDPNSGPRQYVRTQYMKLTTDEWQNVGQYYSLDYRVWLPQRVWPVGAKKAYRTARTIYEKTIGTKHDHTFIFHSTDEDSDAPDEARRERRKPRMSKEGDVDVEKRVVSADVIEYLKRETRARAIKELQDGGKICAMQMLHIVAAELFAA